MLQQFSYCLVNNKLDDFNTYLYTQIKVNLYIFIKRSSLSQEFVAEYSSILFKILINCEIYLILFDIFSMIYTATYRQHISNVYAPVEFLFFLEASSWVVWASLTLLSLINVVASCFIAMNYHQKISLKLNLGSFF